VLTTGHAGAARQHPSCAGRRREHRIHRDAAGDLLGEAGDKAMETAPDPAGLLDRQRPFPIDMQRALGWGGEHPGAKAGPRGRTAGRLHHGMPVAGPTNHQTLAANGRCSGGPSVDVSGEGKRAHLYGQPGIRTEQASRSSAVKVITRWKRPAAPAASIERAAWLPIPFSQPAAEGSETETAHWPEEGAELWLEALAETGRGP